MAKKHFKGTKRASTPPPRLNASDIASAGGVSPPSAWSTPAPLLGTSSERLLALALGSTTANPSTSPSTPPPAVTAPPEAAKTATAAPSAPAAVPTVEGNAPSSVQAEEGPTGAGKAVADEASIRRRAYELFLARAGRPGSATGDWLEAEKQLRAP